MEYYRSYSMIVSPDARVLKVGLQSEPGVSMCLSDNNLKLNVGKTQLLLSWGAGEGCGS